MSVSLEDGYSAVSGDVDANPSARSLHGNRIRLGAELAARSPHRLALAIHVGRLSSTGGDGVSVEEEERIVDYFVGLYDRCIAWTGGQCEMPPRFHGAPLPRR